MRRLPPVGPALLLVASVATIATAESFTIHWPARREAAPVTIDVSGLSAEQARSLQRVQWERRDWQQLFAIYAEQGDVLTDASLPPMLGTYAVHDGTVRFTPQYSLEPGISYRATFRPARLPHPPTPVVPMVTSTFRPPRSTAVPTTVVRQIFPTTNTLPENLLKFYVHFSAPMSRGHIYDFIHLRDASGKPVDLPFLEIDEELWSPDMTRLTLIVDPGRIKRGVRPLEEIGPALEEGKQFTLAIARDWKDATGTPLQRGFDKPFTVGPPDRIPPDPAAWKIHPPRRGTRESLVVNFPEPMEHALAERMLHVVSADGEAVRGSATLDQFECRWTFSPENPWEEPSPKLVIETTIEDLAGNNIGKPFEVDMVETAPRRLVRSTVELRFRLR